ncbi:MAG: hypothetical protein M3Y73_06265 [Actinomycetota bacterium]|nr:hypothetical protein [Actinomycetota bacterium]
MAEYGAWGEWRYRCVLADGHKMDHIGVRIDKPDLGGTYGWRDDHHLDQAVKS